MASEVHLQIRILGNVNVGRMSILRRFVHDTYTDGARLPGEPFAVVQFFDAGDDLRTEQELKTIHIGGKGVTLDLA